MVVVVGSGRWGLGGVDTPMHTMFTDTDSLVYEIKTKDAYEDLYKHKNLLDFSDYPQGSKFFDPVNKKVISKMEDEFGGRIISELLD